METINVRVNGKDVEMVIVEEMPVGEATAKRMVLDGWQVWHGIAKRPNGTKLHLVQRGARFGNYVSLVSL